MNSECPDTSQCQNIGQCLDSPYEMGTYLCTYNVGININAPPFESNVHLLLSEGELLMSLPSLLTQKVNWVFPDA